MRKEFPSPCGVWVVSVAQQNKQKEKEFPSPCGVWVVSIQRLERNYKRLFPSPCGVWVVSVEIMKEINVEYVSVPLRGVGCF